MAQFPIQQARQDLGFVPTTNVRANIDSNTAAGAVGQAVGQGAVKLGKQAIERKKRQDALEEALRVKNRANLDSLSKRQADQRRKQMNAEIDIMKTATPPEEWEKETVGIINTANEDIAAFDFSPQAAAEQQVMAQGTLNARPKQVFSDASRVISAATIKSSEESLTDAYRSNDPTLPQKNIDFITTQKRNGVPAVEILTKQKAAQEAGEALRKGDAIKAKKNQASLAPDVVFAQMEVEKELRKKGEGSPELQTLSNEDLESISDYTKTIGEKRKTISTVNVESAKVDSYSQIRDGVTNIDAMIDAVNIDPTISNEDKAKFAEDIPTYFNKWNSTVSADDTDEDAYNTLLQLAERVERGASSPAQWENKYIELKDKLDTEDQRLVRQKDVVATSTMQNRTFSDAILVTRPTLVELTAGDLESLKLARQNAEIIKDIPSVNMFNISIKKNQAEQWNMGRFRKELRRQIGQNPKWSQEQIFVAQEVLTEQLDLPVGELLKQFDGQNPNRSILKEAPDVILEDIWSELNIDDKAGVWELRMRGVPTRAIVGELPPETQSKFRPDLTLKGPGFLGELKLPDGGVATEFSIGTTDVTGEELDIPTLVPTLTSEEKTKMVTDIIPNDKPVPKAIIRKAVKHAKKRIKEGKSVFLERGEK